MFSGIVEEKAEITGIYYGASSISVKSSLKHDYTKIGDSICINGVCLTVVKNVSGILDFQISPETLSRTNLSNLRVGSTVNLERSLIVGDRIHGHFVFGHIDAVSKLISIQELKDCRDLRFSIPEGMKPYIVEKGSVSLNGVSLTVSAVSESDFTVSVIPHTLSVTNLGDLSQGDVVNFEADMLARYVLNGAR